MIKSHNKESLQWNAELKGEYLLNFSQLRSDGVNHIPTTNNLDELSLVVANNIVNNTRSDTFAETIFDSLNILIAALVSVDSLIWAEYFFLFQARCLHICMDYNCHNFLVFCFFRLEVL